MGRGLSGWKRVGNPRLVGHRMPDQKDASGPMRALWVHRVSVHRAFVIVSLTLPLAAEVAGTVQPQRLADLPQIWGAMSNDALGGAAGRNQDDDRTNALTFQAAIGRSWMVVADHAILTDKADGLRLDEFTATASYLPLRGSRGWLALGGGVRLRGDLRGESTQNAWHDWSHLERVDYLTYEEPDDRVVPVVVASGAWFCPLPTPMTLPGLLSGRSMLEVGGRSLVGSDGTCQGAIEMLVGGRGVDGAVWVGLRYETGEVGTDSPTLEAVRDHERSLALVYGVSVGSWFLSAGSALDSNGAFGRLGFSHGRSGVDGVGAAQPLHGDLVWTPGPSMGAELAWRPNAWSSPWNLALGARFGNAGQSWNDNVVEFRQITGGLANEHVFTNWDQLAVEGYGAVELGIRQDQIIERGSNTPFEEESHITGVAVARAGLRLAWGDAFAANRTVRMGVGAGVVGWAPLTTATVSNGSRSETYATPDVRPEFSLHVTAQW
jgi:hypothetical protein